MRRWEVGRRAIIPSRLALAFCPRRAPLAALRHLGYGCGMSSFLTAAPSARTSLSALALILRGLLLRLART